jgi:hypothetical protein
MLIEHVVFSPQILVAAALNHLAALLHDQAKVGEGRSVDQRIRQADGGRGPLGHALMLRTAPGGHEDNGWPEAYCPAEGSSAPIGVPAALQAPEQ